MNGLWHRVCKCKSVELVQGARDRPTDDCTIFTITKQSCRTMNHMLEELVRAMLTGATLPEFLWEPAVAHAAYLQNLSYTTALLTATPYQAWHGQKLNVSHLHEFGAPVWILLQGQNIQQKMLPKSQHQAYVGIDEGTKVIIYYNVATRNILTLRNYCFLEPSEPSPPEDIVVDIHDDQGEHAPLHEGENNRDQSTQKSNATIPRKRPAENEIDTREPGKPKESKSVRTSILENPIKCKESKLTLPG